MRTLDDDTLAGILALLTDRDVYVEFQYHGPHDVEVSVEKSVGTTPPTFRDGRLVYRGGDVRMVGVTVRDTDALTALRIALAEFRRRGFIPEATLWRDAIWRTNHGARIPR